MVEIQILDCNKEKYSNFLFSENFLKILIQIKIDIFSEVFTQVESRVLCLTASINQDGAFFSVKLKVKEFWF